jgi:hypothetical protein
LQRGQVTVVFERELEPQLAGLLGGPPQRRDRVRPLARLGAESRTACDDAHQPALEAGGKPDPVEQVVERVDASPELQPLRRSPGEGELEAGGCLAQGGDVETRWRVEVAGLERDGVHAERSGLSDDGRAPVGEPLAAVIFARAQLAEEPVKCVAVDADQHR